jgi:hypothetical protein
MSVASGASSAASSVASKRPTAHHDNVSFQGQSSLQGSQTHTLKTGQSKKSQHTLRTSKSEDRTIPDFNEIHTNYSKALVRGRHPNSFPKESELWYHFRSSSERVKKVAFGYDIWEVIEDQESVHKNAERHVKMKSEEDELKAEVNNAVSAQAPTHPNAIQMRTINGVQIDMKGQVPMHYGMVFIMMNMMEEVLCVNKWDQVKCKPIQNIDPTDRICFKVLQLLDPTNPGVLKYGSPMWLQLMDSSLSDGESAWQNSHVLAAKPYAPPEMGSMELDRMWGQSTIRDNKDSSRDKPGSAGESSSSMFPKIGQSSKYPAKSPNKSQKLDSTTPSKAPPTPGAGDNKKGDGKEEKEGESSEAKEGEEAAGGEDGATGDLSPVAATSFGADRSSSIDNEQLAAIIGDLQPARIVDVKRDPDAVMTGPRNHTKTAQYMGQWVGRHATRTKLKGDIIHTQSPVYLEQDLYCLATSHGTGFRPWPKNSSEIEYREANFPKLVHLGNDSARATTFENMNRMMGLVKPTSRNDRLIGGAHGSTTTGASGGTLSSASAHAHTTSSAASGADTISKQPAHRDIGEYGCVRKVSIRGPPYKNLVDRRCVWKFCQVDTQGDMQSLSVKDQITQRLMNRARVELRKSEQNRKGICIHKGYEYRGQPLTRGEGFTRTLRAIILQNTHNREVTDMQERRTRERHLRRYFGGLIYGEDGESVDFDEEDEELSDDEDNDHIGTMGTSGKNASASGDGDDQTFVSQLSDDHFSPYKEPHAGTSATWDDSILKTLMSGAKGEKDPKDKGGKQDNSKGDSKGKGRQSHVQSNLDKIRHKAIRKNPKKSPDRAAGRLSRLSEGNSDNADDDESINSSTAAELLEHAFHVEKFMPEYLPKKPLAYSAPVYDTGSHHYANSEDGPNRRRNRNNSGSQQATQITAGAISAMVAEGRDRDGSDIDFAATLSQELDDISKHKIQVNLNAGASGRSKGGGHRGLGLHAATQNQPGSHPGYHHYNPSAAFSSKDPVGPNNTLLGHPGSHTGSLHSLGSHVSMHGSQSTPHLGHFSPAHNSTHGPGDGDVHFSKDGMRVLALDNHIDLFQSDGERVVAIHDMMDYLTSKTAVSMHNLQLHLQFICLFKCLFTNADWGNDGGRIGWSRWHHQHSGVHWWVTCCRVTCKHQHAFNKSLDDFTLLESELGCKQYSERNESDGGRRGCGSSD